MRRSPPAEAGRRAARCAQVDGSEADFFYVPLYLSCLILPVYDSVGPAKYMRGFPMRPVTAARAAQAALDQARGTPEMRASFTSEIRA